MYSENAVSECEGGCAGCTAVRRLCEECKVEALEEAYWYAIESAKAEKDGE